MDKFLKRKLMIIAWAYLGEISTGYPAWFSPVAVKLQDPDQTPLSGPISNCQLSWIGSVVLPGVMLGLALSAWFPNIFGRKPCLILGGMCNMAGYLLLITAENFWMLLFGRFFVGTGLGIIYVMNLTYIAEISSTNIRGILLTASGVFTSLGILLAYTVGAYFTYEFVMYLGFFMTTVFCIGGFFVPETPAFQLLKGKEIEAKTTLVYLGRSADIEEILSSFPPKVKSVTQGLKDVFLIRANRRAFMISVVIYICQGMSGYVSVMFYVTPIFQSVNASVDPALATIIVGIMQVLSSCVTPLFIERKGRKVMLMISSAGCSLSMAMLGTFFLIQNADNASVSHLHWIPLVSVIVYSISYHSGYMSIPGAFANEMFNSSARGPGSALVLGLSTITCFIMTTVFGYMGSSTGAHVTLLVFAGASAFCCVCTSMYAVETKGKSLAEIQLLLNDSSK